MPDIMFLCKINPSVRNTGLCRLGVFTMCNTRIHTLQCKCRTGAQTHHRKPSVLFLLGWANFTQIYDFFFFLSALDCFFSPLCHHYGIVVTVMRREAREKALLNSHISSKATYFCSFKWMFCHQFCTFFFFVFFKKEPKCEIKTHSHGRDEGAKEPSVGAECSVLLPSAPPQTNKQMMCGIPLLRHLTCYTSRIGPCSKTLCMYDSAFAEAELIDPQSHSPVNFKRVAHM